MTRRVFALAALAGLTGVAGLVPVAQGSPGRSGHTCALAPRAQCAGAQLAGRVEFHGNLRGANLRKADLRGADLRRANLSGADLRGARLNGARLAGATLVRARLAGAKFGPWRRRPQAPSRVKSADQAAACLPACGGANLSNANLTGVNAVGADFTGANLTGAQLVLADFSGANLTGANVAQTTMSSFSISPSTTLTNIQSGGIIGRPNAMFNDYTLQAGYIIGPYVNLTNANLQGVDLGCTPYVANLQGAIGLKCFSAEGANLTGANLQNANVVGLNLTGATLMEANLPGLNLSNQNLAGVNLAGANLAGADLTGQTNLSSANLSGSNMTNVRAYGVVGQGCPNWTGAYVAYANLSGLNIGGPVPEQTSGPSACANLSGANFSNANMTGAYLQGVNMTGTNLVNSNFTNSTMAYVTLGAGLASGANFIGTQGWTVIKLTGGMSWNSSTICPNGSPAPSGVAMCTTETLGW